MNSPKSNNDGSARIKSRMASIRGELRADAESLRESTNRFFDWTAHVREHPLTSLGVFAAAAYFLVPRRVEINSPDADEMEKLAKRNKVVVEANPTPAAKSTFLAGLATLVSHTVLRGAIGLAANELAKAFQPEPGGKSTADAPRAASEGHRSSSNHGSPEARSQGV